MDYWEAVDRAIDDIRYEETFMAYLFALLANDGEIELYEIQSSQVQDFKESLVGAEYLAYRYSVLRPNELEATTGMLVDELREWQRTNKGQVT